MSGGEARQLQTGKRVEIKTFLESYFSNFWLFIVCPCMLVTKQQATSQVSLPPVTALSPSLIQK